MNTYILLLRGINVGGNALLPMKELIVILEELSFENVQVYIQSGNVVLQNKKKLNAKHVNEIGKNIKTRKGFEPMMLLLSLKELQNAIEANPFDTTEGKALHFFFLESAPIKTNISLLESYKSKTEQYKLIDKVFYLYAPDGVGKSKLATTVEKVLGVPATARNWNTVAKLAKMSARDA